jgi:glycosyltransferase involved in cell wall biosynthesis
MQSTNLRVLIVAEHASARFGGEALLPLQYFRLLRKRRIDVRLVVHARVRSELEALLPMERDRIHYVPDTRLHVGLWKLGRRLPARVNTFSLGAVSHLYSQILQRKVVRRIVRDQRVDLVHEPMPVSPRLPSGMFDVGAPVVIGPMNGGMDFPAAFAHLESPIERRAVALLRAGTELANRLIPGKVKAAALVVANPRTCAALPRVTAGVPVFDLVENGVDLEHFRRVPAAVQRHTGSVRFGFVGRLVDWKAVDILLEAFAALDPALDTALEILGDGEERPTLEAQARRLGIERRVRFHGFVPHEEIAERMRDWAALVLPSLRECGGAVVLEAMAVGLPVIATRWGGPADYLDESCGILIDPTSRDTMVTAVRDAMSRLARDRELRQGMGARGRAKVEAQFDWELKIDEMLRIYEECAAREQRPAA